MCLYISSGTRGWQAAALAGRDGEGWRGEGRDSGGLGTTVLQIHRKVVDLKEKNVVCKH